MALREIFHFVQNDKFVHNGKVRPRGHRLGVINARSGRLVAVSSNGIKVAKFDESKITFRKRPFPAPR